MGHCMVFGGKIIISAEGRLDRVIGEYSKTISICHAVYPRT